MTVNLSRTDLRTLTHATRSLVVVDMVESVRLVEQHEDELIGRWLAFMEHVSDEILPVCGGQLVKSLGDGMLLEFDHAQGAVKAALWIQQSALERNAGYAPDQHILLRVGIETGDVIRGQGDVFGRGVNRAARLATLAAPGEVVASAGVRAQITPVLDAEIEDLGDCYLRHVNTPVRAYRVGPPGPLPRPDAGPPLRDLMPSLAVVPFSSLNEQQDHFMLGEILAEEMISEMSRSQELCVISRLSTTAFRDRGLQVQEIGRRLNANYIVSGDYRTQQGALILNVEIADALTGQVAQSRQYRAKLNAILRGKREFIDQIIAELSAAVMTREALSAQTQPLPTLKNYTLLLGAVSLMHRLSPPDFARARRMLDALIERATRQAVPQAWLAKWHVLRVQQGWSPDPVDDARQALRCTSLALNADPNCSLALAIDGFVHTNLLKKLDVAQSRYERAIEANPNDSLAWLLKGTLHAFRGEGQPAVAAAQHALRLSPLDPHRYFYDSLAATSYLAAHQFTRALQSAKRSLKANRTHTSTWRALAIAQWSLGQHDEARKTVQGLMSLDPSLTIRSWRERSPSADFAIGQEWAEALGHAGVPA
ncbi:FlgO family outer membrane protein [Alsobacter sp. KACC 23698]|uniref:FlgO family outer membrane protein n=1 Tax=Alsobacter sp. KACC 23698 TaxID=3149229 RepID=A0AAU7JH76_9HYPH